MLKQLIRANSGPRVNRETAATMLTGLSLLVGIFLYFWARLYSGYLLVHDDPGNIGGTMEGGLRGWVTRGMAGYYHVYPEWPQPAFSNFYRPVWNLIIFVEQSAFGQHYWAWFLAYCTVQYCGAFLFLRVLRFLNVPSRQALLFTILFLFNPAFLNFGFVYPGFQFDIFVSLLLLAALSQLFECRFGLALALITVAVFTKETAIFAPIAAAATVYILKRDAKWSAVMFTPLLAWITARWLAFHAVMGGTFASPASIGDVFTNIGRSLLIWPSGAVSAGFPLTFSGIYGIAQLTCLLINTTLWLILIYAGWQVASDLRQTPLKTGVRRQAVLLIWVLGALSFCMLTRPQIRFGASFYPFLLLFLSYFLFARTWSKYLRLIPILIVSFVTLIRGGNFLWHTIANVSAERHGEKALFSSLQSLPQDGRTVFIVNAPTMLSAPIFLTNAWNLKLNVVFINQFLGCPHAKSGDASYHLSPMSLSVEIPSCASYVFAGVPDDIQSKALIDGLSRSGIGMYEFASAHDGIKRLNSGDIDFGRMMRIEFARAPGTILAYDWQTSIYRAINLSQR